jgi:hypothetical protein
MLGYVSVGRGGDFSYMGLVKDCRIFSLSNISPTGPLFVSPLALVSGLEPWILSYFLPVFFFNSIYCWNVPVLSSFYEPGKTGFSSLPLLADSLFWTFSGLNISILPVLLPCASLPFRAKKCACR